MYSKASQAPELDTERPIEETLSRGEASKELHDVFSPLASLVASEVKQEDAIELFREVDTLPLVILDNQMTMRSLPWDALVGIDELNIVHFKDFKQRYDDAGSKTLGDLMDEYSDSYWQPFLNHIVENYRRLHPDMPLRGVHNTQNGLSVDAFEWRLDRDFFRPKTPFDFERWKSNETALGQLPENEQREYERYKAVRWANVNKWHGLKNDPGFVEAKSIVYAHDSDMPEDDANVLNHPIVAVGEYGEEFAQELIRVAMAMNRKAEQVLSPMAEALTEQKADLLTTYTARANENGASSRTTKDTVNEGILSIMQVLSILTCEKVEGYDNPIDLVRALVSSGLVEKFARYSPMGMVGPMAIGGYHLPGSVEKEGERLVFSEQLSEYLKKERDAYFGRITVMRAEAEEQLRGQKGEGQIYLGATCPVAGKGDGIRQLSDAFVACLDKRAAYA